MEIDKKVFSKVGRQAVSGQGAHVELKDVFAGLDWKTAGEKPAGAPHTLYQLLNHVVFWQDWAIKWLDGGKPAVPRHASGSWPGGAAPSNPREWKAAERRLLRALDELDHRARDLDLLSRRGSKTRLEMIATIGAHSSYHAGQATVVRQMLGKWPPPSGGITW